MGQVWPSSGTVDDFLEGATANGFTVNEWRPGGDGYTLGAAKYDQVTNRTYEMEFLLAHVDAAGARCPNGAMVVSAATLAGEELDLPTLGGIVAQWGTPGSPSQPEPGPLENQPSGGGS